MLEEWEVRMRARGQADMRENNKHREQLAAMMTARMVRRRGKEWDDQTEALWAGAYALRNRVHELIDQALHGGWLLMMWDASPTKLNRGLQ